ncbi:MAG: Spy/CpxP family protein refolding chaperone [Thermodesulfobacteriota bacterium]
MKQKLIITTMAIFLLAGVSLTANARECDGTGYGPQTISGSEYGKNDWRGHHRQDRREMVAEFIGLSEEQQEQIEAIRAEERSGSEALREKLWDYREQMRELTDAGSFDEKTIRAIAEEKAEIQVELAVSKARMHSRIHAVMTPEQQELAQKLRSTRKNKRGKSRRGQWGGRR